MSSGGFAPPLSLWAGLMILHFFKVEQLYCHDSVTLILNRASEWPWQSSSN